jgi:cytidylate kinase
MAASVVTFTVQVGSGGFAIARGVADKLGYRYYDWEITSEAAARAGVSPDLLASAERLPGLFERVMRRLIAASAVSGEESHVMIEPPPAMVTSAVQSLNLDEYRRFIEHVVTELADQGNAVIVGHAAQAILKRPGGVLKVLVSGSAASRAERLAAEQTTSADEAMASLRLSDRERGDFFRRAYKIDWLESSVYDLALNTDRLPVEFLEETVVSAARNVL